MSEPALSADVARWVESRLVNPVVRAVLRSPLHPLVSRWLCVLAYEGRRTGRRYATPVLYVRDGDAYVVTTLRAEAAWWRNFRESHPATLRVAGERVPVTGRASVDDAAVADWLAELDARGRGRLPSVLGVPADADRAARERAATRLVVVRFAPR